MRVVQVVTQMEAGGAQRVAVLLGSAFGERGLDHELWFIYKKRPAYDQLPWVRCLADAPARSRRQYGEIVFRLWRRITQERPDVLITHTHYANILAQPAAVAAGIRCRIAVQHSPIHSYPVIARRIDRALGSTGAYTANIAVSKTVADSVAHYPDAYRRRTATIYNGVQLNTVGTDRASTRMRYGLPADRHLLLMVGRLAPVKNHELALNALKDLDEVHLAILGDGELRTTLEALAGSLGIADRVHFLGEHPAERVGELLSTSDAFVFPSHYEAMPMALVEAMAAGVPIVASDIPANREVLGTDEGNIAGVLCDPMNAVQLAREIRSLRNSPERRELIVNAAAARAQRFGVRQMVDGYLSVINA